MDRHASRDDSHFPDPVETQGMPNAQLFANGSNVPCKSINSEESSASGSLNVIKTSSSIDQRAHGEANTKSVISLRMKETQGSRIEHGRSQATDVLWPNSPKVGNLIEPGKERPRSSFDSPHLPCKRKIDKVAESSSRVHAGDVSVHSGSSPSNYPSGTNITRPNSTAGASDNHPCNVTQNLDGSQRKCHLRIDDPSPHNQRSPGTNQFGQFDQSAESSSSNSRISPSNDIPADTQQVSNLGLVPSSQDGPGAPVSQLSSAPPFSQNQNLSAAQVNLASTLQVPNVSRQTSTASIVEADSRISPRNLVQHNSNLMAAPTSQAGHSAQVGQLPAAVSPGSSIPSAGSVAGPGQNVNAVVAPQNSASSSNLQELRRRVAVLLRGFRESQRTFSYGPPRENMLMFMWYLSQAFGRTTDIGQFMGMLLLDDARIHTGVARLNDRHRALRLDIDNMSYEELLALGERIGHVNLGLSEEKILKSLKQHSYSYVSLAQETPIEAESCCICKEEYAENDITGTLDCGHDFHTNCIKQWLVLKNLCPICRATGLAA